MLLKVKNSTLYEKVVKIYHTLLISLFFSPCVQFFYGLKGEKEKNLRAAKINSKSQLLQDVFVLHELNFKEGGFFVEFGATNGVELSNSHLLEKEFHWQGILAEPARVWYDDLKKSLLLYRK